MWFYPGAFAFFVAMGIAGNSLLCRRLERLGYRKVGTFYDAVSRREALECYRVQQEARNERRRHKRAAKKARSTMGVVEEDGAMGNAEHRTTSGRPIS